MFALRLPVLAALLAAAALVLSTARPSSGAGAATRHVVAPGETLWEIADRRYGGDPREGVWRIRERNGLGAAPLVPGTVLFLPP